MLPVAERLPVKILPQPDETTCGPTCLHAIYRYWGEDEPLTTVIGRAQRFEGGGTVAGYDCDRHRVLVADPYGPNPFSPTQEYWINVDRVVNAVLLGIVTHDANLLIISPRGKRTRARSAAP